MTETTPAAAQDNLGRPAPGQRHVTAALFVDFGDKSRPPRAKYECVRCQTTEGPVHGPEQVAAFVANVKTAHHARCKEIHP